jgi:oxalate decarboxylase
MQLRHEKEHSMTQADDQGMVTTIRGEDGASVLGPDNVPIGSQNPGRP